MSSIEKEINAEKKTLSDLLREKYTVDYFQREYKWEKKHIEQLLIDLEASFLANYEEGHTLANVADYNGYYLGPVVICKQGRSRSIVDGQQRLTSITLLLIYLNNLQKDNAELEEISHLIFSRKGGINSYNIEIPIRQEILDSLFKEGEYETAEDDDISVRNMNDRYIDIMTCFSEELKNHKLPLFIEWLKDNVVFVEILAHSNENAYTIFETMNDRGLNLTPTEMLKGYVLTNIADAERIEEINDLWKKHVSNLYKYSLQEDQEFIKAWLRGAYADTIRPSIKGAENEDFEKIGTRFHTWVKDNHKKIGLKDKDSFYFFVKGDFDFYANLYSRILNAERYQTEKLEILYLASQWKIANSLLYPLLIASINKMDDESTIIDKLNVVYRFLDIYTVSRSLNHRSITQTALRYTLYSWVKEIRNKDVNDLRSILRAKIETSAETNIDNLTNFNYQYDNRKFVHYFIARIIYYVETEYAGKEISFNELLPSRRRSRLVLSPIVGWNIEQYGHYFESENDFNQTNRLLGNYILVPNAKVDEFNDCDNIEKLQLLRGDNLFSETLSQTLPHSNQLGLFPIEEMSANSLRLRTHQLIQIAKEIWNPELI